MPYYQQFPAVIPHSEADHPRVTHPFAALLGGCPPFARDLHVLGTPPALILSQDQTLQLNLNASCEALFVLKILLGPCESESRRNCLCLPSFQRATPTLGDQTRIPNCGRAVNPFFWPLRRRVRLGGKER